MSEPGNTLKPIVVVRRGDLASDDIQKLEMAGYVVVESRSGRADALSIVSGVALPFDGTGIVHAAFAAMGQHKTVIDAFGANVRRLCFDASKPKDGVT